MPQLNKIVNLQLESRARELRDQEFTLRKIASILTEESGQQISKNNVENFFKLDNKTKAEIIEKKEELNLKVVEAELSTLEIRKRVINKLVDVFETCETKREYSLISKELKEHLDSLDKRLGTISPDSNNTIINIQQNNLTIRDQMKEYEDIWDVKQS